MAAVSMMTTSTILPAGRSSGGVSSARTDSSPARLTPPPHGDLLGGGHLSLSMEKLLSHASATGSLQLCARNLKKFPQTGDKFKLKDTVVADMSRNKLSELPDECTDFASLEKLVLYHNTIRSIPDSVAYLQSLQFLDLSRNQLSYLPPSICQLPCLQGLIVNNNRLVSLPEEIGRMQSLMELDASCNEITHLPVQIGDLASLKSLNLRRNHLQEIPVEISYLQLTFLDMSGNRISVLPNELRFMTTVVDLNLGENPLTCPPANLCSRGRIHVFKYLEIQAIKEDRKRGVLTEGEYRRSYRKTGTGQLSDFRFANGFNADARRKRHTADSGYGSEQPLDRRWSQEFSQEVMDMHTEDARRIVLRAAANSTLANGVSSGKVPLRNGHGHIQSRLSYVPLPPPPAHLLANPNSGNGSSNVSSASSSGYSSIEHPPSVTPTPSSNPCLPSPAKVAPPSSSSGNSSTASMASSSSSYSPTLRENGLQNGETVGERGRAAGSNLGLPKGVNNRGMGPQTVGLRHPRTPKHPVGSPPKKSLLPNGNLNGLETEFHKMMDGMFSHPQASSPSAASGDLALASSAATSKASNRLANSDCHLPASSLEADSADQASSNGHNQRGGSPDDAEKEERRRAAKKVLGKHGAKRSVHYAATDLHSDGGGGAKRPTSLISPTKSQLPSPRHTQPLPVPTTQPSPKPLPSPGSLLPLPKTTKSGSNTKQPQQAHLNPQSYRQYKEHLRQQRSSTSTYQEGARYQNGSSNGEATEVLHQSQSDSRIATSTVTSRSEKKSLTSGSRIQSSADVTHSKLTSTKVSSTSSINQSFDMKTMQKEAVLSYVKSKQAASSSTSSSPSRQPSGSSQPPVEALNNHLRQRIGSGLNPGSRSSSTSSIPQPMNGAQQPVGGQHPGRSFIARRDMEKAVSSDTHINQLRMHIENRLRITLPDDLAGSLQDGVVLCHIANHVKPRAVPSIHVPSPAVPKLNAAKCRRNVENFLLACRKIGVRDDLICSPADILEPRKQGTVRISLTVSDLLRFYQPKIPLTNGQG